MSDINLKEISTGVQQLFKQLSDLGMRIEAMPPAPQYKFLGLAYSNVKNLLNNDRMINHYMALASEQNAGPLLMYLYPKAKNNLINYFTQVASLEHAVTTYESSLKPVLSTEQSSGLGFTWPWEEDVSDPANDRNRGLEILQSFYDQAVSLGLSQYPTIDDFTAYLDGTGSDVIATVGSLPRLDDSLSRNVTMDTAKSQMINLANKLQGQMPASVSVFVTAAGQPLSELGWLTNVEPVANAAAAALAPLIAVGDGLIAAGSTTTKLLKYLPYIAIGLGGLYVYTLAKSGKLPFV